MAQRGRTPVIISSEAPNSTIARRRLATQLRRLREVRELTQKDAANELRFSESKLIRIENEVSGVALDGLELMLGLYGVPKALREPWFELARLAKQPGPLGTHADRLDRHTQRIYELTDGAASISAYSNMMLPELLQTTAYTRDVLAKFMAGSDADEIEGQVQVRARRREALVRAKPPQLRAVVDESTLRRLVEGAPPEIAEEQLTELGELASWHGVRLRVLSLQKTGVPVVPDFAIVSFDYPYDLPFQYHEPQLIPRRSSRPHSDLDRALSLNEASATVERSRDWFRQLSRAAAPLTPRLVDAWRSRLGSGQHWAPKADRSAPVQPSRGRRPSRR